MKFILCSQFASQRKGLVHDILLSGDLAGLVCRPVYDTGNFTIQIAEHILKGVNRIDRAGRIDVCITEGQQNANFFPFEHTFAVLQKRIPAVNTQLHLGAHGKEINRAGEDDYIRPADLWVDFLHIIFDHTLWFAISTFITCSAWTDLHGIQYKLFHLGAIFQSPFDCLIRQRSAVAVPARAAFEYEYFLSRLSLLFLVAMMPFINLGTGKRSQH